MAKAKQTEAPSERDGRQRRSERSREAIVQALLDLVGAGVLRPTAQQIAESAGVGIRTVFRHFSDVEGLFAAMNARVQAQALPLLREVPPEGSAEARARALIGRRLAFFERIAPYKRSGGLQRWRSPFLQGQHAALVKELRADLLRWIPELSGAPAELVDALDLALSFEAWNRLRSEQRLGRERTGAVLERMVLALLRGLPR